MAEKCFHLKIINMYYYDIHVTTSRSSGYSFGLVSETELLDDEAIEQAVKQNRFENEGDDELVDEVLEVDERYYKENFGEV